MSEDTPAEVGQVTRGPNSTIRTLATPGNGSDLRSLDLGWHIQVTTILGLIGSRDSGTQ